MKNKSFAFIGLIVCGLIVFAAPPALAGCTAPARAESKTVYNADFKILQYCDGTNWIAMHQPGSGNGGCTNPPRPEGRIVYNKDFRVIQACAGNQWEAMGPVGGPLADIYDAAGIPYTTIQPPFAIALSGNFAYIASLNELGGTPKDYLQVLDISDPDNPLIRATLWDPGLNAPAGVAVSGTNVYVTGQDSASLAAYDVSNPDIPFKRSSLSTANLDGAASVAISGNFAYVAASLADAITIVDISNPDNLVERGTLSNANLAGAQGIFVSGTDAYVAAQNAGAITIIDVSDPDAPTERSSLSTANLTGAGGIFVSGNFAYVAAQNASAITIIDVSDPDNPVERSSLSNANLDGANNVFLSGSNAYVAAGEAGALTVVDVTDPDNPIERSSHQNTTSLPDALSVVIDNTNAYVISPGDVGGDGGGLTVVDISNPNSPSTRSITPAVSDDPLDFDMAISGNIAYVGSVFVGKDFGEMIVAIDISDPNNPFKRGILDSAAISEEPTGFSINGNFLYVASWGNDSFTVIDVSDPDNLVKRGSIVNDTVNLGAAWSVAYSSSVAYVAANNNDALTSVDVSNPDAPFVRDTISSPNLDAARNLVVDGAYAYVASGWVNAGLAVVDISDPDNLVERDSITNARIQELSAIAVSGNYAYLTSSGTDYFIVVDISDPDNLVERGGFLLPLSAGLSPQDMKISGSRAYIVSSFSGNEYSYGVAVITIMDISDPDNPRIENQLFSANHFYALALGLSGNNIYTANTQPGGGFRVVGLNGIPPDNICTLPNRAQGTLLYNAQSNIMQYCAGTNWVSIGKEAAVSGPPVWITPAGTEIFNINEGDVVAAPVWAIDDTSVTYSFNGGEQGWMSINGATGMLNLSPVDGDNGSYNVTVRATDEDTEFTDRTFRITVNDTVLCTYYYKRDMLPENVYRGDVAYSYKVNRQTRRAYHFWAKPLIKYIDSHKGGWVDRTVFFFVSRWANEMSYRMGYDGKANVIGWIMREAGEPLHYLAGFVIKKKPAETIPNDQGVGLIAQATRLEGSALQ